MADTAADVPGKFDVIINGHGYCLADSVAPSLPFRTHRAIYDITPTFVERQNVSNQYGDQAQDFFMTASQNDWSLGEGQHYAHLEAPDTLRASWKLENVKVSDAGRVTLLAPSSSIATGTPQAAASNPASSHSFVATVANLYNIAFGSTNSFAHGLGVPPTTCAHDGTFAYLSATAGGTLGVRKGDATGALTTFSATASDVLAFHNNSLYGLVNSTGILQVYDTAGAATTLFQFKGAAGAAAPQTFTGMASFGGKLVFTTLGQLWMYDGTGTSLIAQFPTNFLPNLVAGSPCIAVASGIVFVSGIEYHEGAAARPVVYYYANGTVGKLWTSTGTLTNAKCRIASFDGGIVWNDAATARILYWDPSTGATSSLFAYVEVGSSGMGPMVVANYSQLLIPGGANAGTDTAYLTISGTATSGAVTSSLFDFDNSLTKMFRGVKIDFDAATDGNGGSVDIAYRVNDVDGAYTSLQTGAVSGTEYTLTGITGRSISIKVTLNKGTSTSGPVLKRIYVRAAPQLRQFKSGMYVLDCTGTQMQPRQLRDGTYHPLTGYQQVQNLLAAAQSTTPISITDKVNGTFTGLVDLQDGEGWDVYEIHPSEDNPTQAGSYMVRLKVREV